jgi:hypothetical protein
VTAGPEQLANAASLRRTEPSVVAIAIALFAVIHLGLALFMATAPHTFYTAVGPFGALNAHYIRDVSTYEAAIGVGLAIAVRRISWRVPVLAVTTIQYGLHSVNHLVDIGKAHPAWNGYLDFFSLAAGTLLLAWLWRAAAQEERSSAGVRGARKMSASVEAPRR